MKKRDELIHKEKLDVAAAAAGNHITWLPFGLLKGQIRQI